MYTYNQLCYYIHTQVHNTSINNAANGCINLSYNYYYYYYSLLIYTVGCKTYNRPKGNMKLFRAWTKNFKLTR